MPKCRSLGQLLLGLMIALVSLGAQVYGMSPAAKGLPLILVPGTFGSWLEADIDNAIALSSRGVVGLALRKGYLREPDWESHRKATFVNGGAVEAVGYVDPFADTYAGFIDYLTAEGWHEEVDFWVFTYDTLRVGIQDNARNLGALVREVRARTGSDRVRLVAHSQGCLVARYYAECIDADSVASLVLLAPPNHGVVGVYKAKQVRDVGDFVMRLFVGDARFDEVGDGAATARIPESAEQFPAIWQMLPDIPYLYTDTSWLSRSALQLRSDPFDSDQYPQPETPILTILNDPDNLRRLRGISIYIVQGWGTNTDEWYEVGKPNPDSEVWRYGKFEKTNATKQGDGIVLTRSAHLSIHEAEWGSSTGAPRWVEMDDGVRYKFIPLKGVRHTDYCRADAIKQWLPETGIGDSRR